MSLGLVIEGANEIIDAIKEDSGMKRDLELDRQYLEAFDKWYATFDGKYDMDLGEAHAHFTRDVYRGEMYPRY